MRTSTTGLAATILLLHLCAAALTPAAAFSGYRETTLDNGLRVVLIEHRANPMVASSVVVGAGVVHEREDEGGGSHLLEHLLFNGTTTRTQRQLYDEVDRVGAYNNATTRDDHTLFTLLIQKEFAERGLDLQADMLFRSTIPPENFPKEKEIVLEEMARDASDPAAEAAERFRAFAYAGTPLARPILGTVESIRGIARESVLRYYRRRYVPANMVLIVMGDFETAAMLESVRKSFGRAPGGAPAPREKGTRWPAAPERNLSIAPLEAPSRTVHLAFPLGLDAHDPLLPAVDLLLDSLAEGDDAPLRRELTAGPAPAATGLSVSVARRAGGFSTVEIEASLAPDAPHEPVLAAIARGLRNLGPGSPARSRFDLVRARVRAREILESDQIHYFALTHADALLGSPPGWLSSAGSRFDGIAVETLDRAAAHLASALSAVRAGVYGPGLEPATSPWDPFAVELPTRAAGPARVERSLPSGLRAVVERNDDSEVFAVHLLFRARAASEPEGKEGIVSFLHRLMPRGTTTLDAASLSVRLARVGASLKSDDDARVPYDDYYTTPEFSFVRLEAPSDGWREAVSLLAEVVLHPRLAPDDVEAVRAEMLELVERRSASSRNRATAALDAALAPGHAIARPVLGTKESIASITGEDLRAFHRNTVTGQRAILTVVSPVPPEEVLAAIEADFRGLPEGSAVTPPSPVPVTAEGRDTGLPDSLPAQVTIALGSVFDAPEEDRAALAVAGGMLSDALAFDLRETRGLAYSIGASIAPWGGRMRLLVTMGTRRENLDEALAGLRRGISEFSVGDEEAVRRAAAALRGRMLMRRLTRINQAYFLGLELMEGGKTGEERRRLDAILGVNRESAAAALARAVAPERLTVVVE
jgi:predicted Zn-dependent peptidase